MQPLGRTDNTEVGIAAAHPIQAEAWSYCKQSPRPGLLVSVRDLDEARLAVASQVSIIDIKEPQQGALGAVSPAVWRAVANEFGDGVLSAAMGELDEAMHLAGRVPAEFRFAKAGPVGARNRDELIRKWKTLRSQLPASVELVAVAYADEPADVLPVETIFVAARNAGFSTWLLDTWVKDGKSSIEHLGVKRLRQLLDHAATANARFALAGSLTLSSTKLHFDKSVLPSWFAVRGDVCEHGRSGRISSARIARWTSWLDTLEPITMH